MFLSEVFVDVVVQGGHRGDRRPAGGDQGDLRHGCGGRSTRWGERFGGDDGGSAGGHWGLPGGHSGLLRGWRSCLRRRRCFSGGGGCGWGNPLGSDRRADSRGPLLVGIGNPVVVVAGGGLSRSGRLYYHFRNGWRDERYVNQTQLDKNVLFK